MTTEEALAAINEKLRIMGVVTFKGDEVKCWTRDDGPDGHGFSKDYLTASDCQAMADAFGFLALGLAAPSGSVTR